MEMNCYWSYEEDGYFANEPIVGIFCWHPAHDGFCSLCYDEECEDYLRMTNLDMILKRAVKRADNNKFDFSSKF